MKITHVVGNGKIARNHPMEVKLMDCVEGKQTEVILMSLQLLKRLA